MIKGRSMGVGLEAFSMFKTDSYDPIKQLGVRGIEVYDPKWEYHASPSLLMPNVEFLKASDSVQGIPTTAYTFSGFFSELMKPRGLAMLLTNGDIFDNSFGRNVKDNFNIFVTKKNLHAVIEELLTQISSMQKNSNPFKFRVLLWCSIVGFIESGQINQVDVMNKSIELMGLPLAKILHNIREENSKIYYKRLSLTPYPESHNKQAIHDLFVKLSKQPMEYVHHEIAKAKDLNYSDEASADTGASAEASGADSGFTQLELPFSEEEE